MTPMFRNLCRGGRQFLMMVLLLTMSALSPAAEKLTVEQLGVVERQARVRGHAFSPGTKDYPPRLLIGFVDGDGTWIVNLQDGTSREATAPGFKEDYIQWPTFIGADGKLFSSCGRGGLSVYDPVTDQIRLVRPIPDARWLRGVAIGPAGAVYVSDYPTGSAAKYDPATGTVTNFGRQGGPFKIPNIYGYSTGCDGRYVYTAAGKIPWYVVAYDTTTATQQNLLQFGPADHPEVHQRGDNVFLEVTVASPGPGEAANRYYRLSESRAIPIDSIPRFDDSYVPGHGQPQPEYASLERNLPVSADGASVRYRMPGEEWKTAKIPVSGQNMAIERISPLADGQLLVSTGPYGNVHRFDPKTKSYSPVGNPASKNVYDMLETGGKVYFCGYPNSILGSFADGSGSLIGNWHDSLGSKHALFLLQGADGRLYSGNHNERESTGGALGWFDPKSGEFGGLHFPQDDCEWLTTALQGRLMVYASDFTKDPARPEAAARNGKLLIFDTATRKIIREVTPLNDGSAGVVVETQPGVLFGLGLHDKLPMMYTVELATGRVGQRTPLPARAYRTLTLGPDGKVYFFAGDSLVRADPASLEVETLCPAEPGRMVFLGDDLYLAGTAQLRRITNNTGRN